MTWSYNPADLATNEVDAIRVEIGDTDINNQRLQNEEIQWAINQERNLWCAAARCAEMISFVYIGKADVKLGRSMSVAYAKMAEQYVLRAKQLRAKAMGTVVPYAGGVNILDKVMIEQNNALVAPAFTRNMQQNPWTGGYTPDSLPSVGSNQDDAGEEF